MFRKPSRIIRRLAMAGAISLALANVVDAAPSRIEIDQAVRDLSNARFEVSSSKLSTHWN